MSEINVLSYGAVGDGSTDNSTAFANAISATPNGGTLYIPSGIYNVNTSLTGVLGKTIRIRGDSAYFSSGSVVRRTADITVFTGGGTSSTSFCAFSVEHVIFRSSGGPFTANPMISIQYAQFCRFYNMQINGGGDTTKGLSLTSVWDSVWVGSVFLGIGNSTNGSLHLEQANGNFNNNYCHFMGCHFEFGTNASTMLVYIEGGINAGQNNTIVFTNCKVETTATCTCPVIHVIGGNRIRFDSIQLTNLPTTTYGSTSAIIVGDTGTVTQDIQFDLDVSTSTATGLLATISNVDGLEFRVRGRNIGAYSLGANVFRPILDVQDGAEVQPINAHTLQASAIFDQTYLQQFATQVFAGGSPSVTSTIILDSTTFSGYAIQGPQGNSTTIMKFVPNNVSRFLNGVTIWVKAKCTSVLPIAYEIRTSSGTVLSTGTTAASLTTTGYTWVHFAISPDLLVSAGGTPNYVQIYNGASLGTDSFTIAEFYMDSQWYGAAAPTAGTWEVGAKAVNQMPSAGGTDSWRCVTAGSPGTWKAVSLSS